MHVIRMSRVALIGVTRMCKALSAMLCPREMVPVKRAVHLGLDTHD